MTVPTPRRRRRRQHPRGHGPRAPGTASEVVLRAEGDGADEALDQLVGLLSRDLDAGVSVRSAPRRQHYGIGVSPGAAVGPVRAGAPAGASARRGSPPRPTWRRPDDGCARRWSPSPPTLEERAGAADATAQRDPRGDRDDGARPGPAPGGRTPTSPRGAVRPRPLDAAARSTAPGSSPPVATSPSASPTCATSATGPSPACSGRRSRGCPPSRSRASSWPTTSRRPRRPALDPAVVLAIVTEAGGRTSHTADPRRPAGHPGRRAGGRRDRAPRRHAGRRRRRLRAGGGQPRPAPTGPSWSSAPSSGPGCWRPATGPGAPATARPVALLVNIGTVQDAVTAAAQDVEGVGLFRTEFALPRRGHRPQPGASRPRPTPGCSSRSPAAASSSAPWTPAPTSRCRSPTWARRSNPALGRRGLRLSALRPDLLDTQLAALARAARATGADVRVMAPDGRHRRGGRLVRPPGPRERPARRSG